MWTDEVELLGDVTAADWIDPRLTGDLGHLTGTIPSGFAAYARVLHPVDRGPEGTLSWAEVAAVTGGVVHPEVQWHALIGAPDPWAHRSDLWPEGEPLQGNLPLPQLLALCDVLSEYTTTPDDCWFALWEGWGQLNAGARSMLTLETGRRRWLPPFRRRHRGTPVPPVIAHRDFRAAPRVHLPARDHLLFRGPLAAMDAFVHYDGPGTPFTQSPALFWPADLAWCVATEIDFDSTLVAGSAAAVEAVLAAPGVESLRLNGTESLRHDADTVNH